MKSDTQFILKFKVRVHWKFGFWQWTITKLLFRDGRTNDTLRISEN